jgi:molybdopterin-guanine dinucleotide biosynthesis protein A
MSLPIAVGTTRSDRLRVFGMIVDALILAGGRSSRLDCVAKSQFSVGGVSLLSRTVQAVTDVSARRTVIVGDQGVVGDQGMDGVLAIREEPVFAGPVAAIAAGLRALPGDCDAVLVLACDMPAIASALHALLSDVTGDGTIAVDRGRRQPLAVVVRRPELDNALAGLPTVVDASMRDLVSLLDLTEVVVPDGSTDDIDTWDDVVRLGATAPAITRSTT